MHIHFIQHVAFEMTEIHGGANYLREIESYLFSLLDQMAAGYEHDME